MVIGSFGPWARVFIVSVSGVEADGWIVALAAAGAGVALYLYTRRLERPWWPPTIAAICGGVGLLVVAISGEDIFGNQSSGEEDELFGATDLVTPGWGIIVAGLASASLIAASVAL